MSDEETPRERGVGPLPPGVTQGDVDAYTKKLGRCWVVAGLLLELPLEELNRIADMAETMGPIRHPEIWRRNAQPIMEDREMLAALTTAQRHIITASPSLELLAPMISTLVDELQPLLDRAFREIFNRPMFSHIPPAAILTALVRFIGDRAPFIKEDSKP